MRRLAVLGALVGAVAAIRAQMIEADRRQFDQRYPLNGSTGHGST